MKALFNGFMVGSFALLLATCGDNAVLPESAVTGHNPTLPAPMKTLIPTVNIGARQRLACRRNARAGSRSYR
jgi:hypothetical protein